MNTRVLPIDSVAVTNQAEVMTCYGLGSCVGLFITDRINMISAGAHIPMPFPGGDYRDAKALIDEMLNGLLQLGSNLRALRAKLTGGAHVVASSWLVGSLNCEVVVQQLIAHRIYIASADVGGCCARTARYNTATGELIVSVPNKSTYTI